MPIRKLHHVAYRCHNAHETVDFYPRVLGLKFAHAVRNDQVPSTREFYPHLHLFFEMADGSYIAFFELPTEDTMEFDPNTPRWVQHLALEIDDESALANWITRLRANGVDIIGPTDHGFVRSIYFFDPNGHRLELTCRTATPDYLTNASRQAYELLARWQAERADWRGE